MTIDQRTARLHSQIVSLLPALRAFSHRLCAYRIDAEDLVQDTVARALENLDRYNDGTNMKAWLFTIMRNRFCSIYQVTRRESPGLTECVADLRTTEPSQEWEVFSHQVGRKWRTLPRQFREVLEAVAIDGRSYDEVAGEFDCAVGTIKSRLNRARHELVAKFGSLNPT